MAASFALVLIAVPVYFWARLRFPLQVSYLIPQARYELAEFKGAPATESHQNRLAIGEGTYLLPLWLKPRLDIDVQDELLDFVGEGTAPEIISKEEPFYVERAAGGHYRDWHGIPHKERGVYQHGLVRVLGWRIRTRGQFQGKARIRLLVRNRPTAVFRLIFAVDPAADDNLAFLKGWTPLLLPDEERERRQKIISDLRTAYIAQESMKPSRGNILLDPVRLMGPIPKEWVDAKLEQLGEPWRQDEYRAD